MSETTKLYAGALQNGDKRLIDKYISQDLIDKISQLSGSGRVLESQLPSWVDDVVEFQSLNDFPSDGESGKIYISLSDNKMYRWSGVEYVELSGLLELGETDDTAYQGSKGKVLSDSLYEHKNNSNNPHDVTKVQIGLSNVDNTSDLDKPISHATQLELDKKSNSNHSHNVVDILGIDEVLDSKVDKEEGKGLSANDFTDTLLNKINGISAGAQVNVIEGIKINSTAFSITDKVATITKASALSALNVADGAQANILEGINLNGSSASISNKIASLISVVSVITTQGSRLTSTGSYNSYSGAVTFGVESGYSIPSISNQNAWNDLKNLFESLFEYDQATDAIRAKKPLYSDSWISSMGIGTSGGGGSTDLFSVWQSLTNLSEGFVVDDNTKINVAHIPNLEMSKINGLSTALNSKSDVGHTHAFSELTSKPTTLSGYGITDAKIVGGVITLGSSSITPLTSHQSLDNYYTKSQTEEFNKSLSNSISELGGHISSTADNITLLEDSIESLVFSLKGIDYALQGAVSGLSVSGQTITYTKVNGSTGTLSTQDTRYSASTGLTLSNTTFSLNVATATTLGGVKIGDFLARDGSDKLYVLTGSAANTVCAGNDSRLSNSRPASDVYSWAKASTKPSYTTSEVTEGSRLYFTDARAKSALSSDTTALYNGDKALSEGLAQALGELRSNADSISLLADDLESCISLLNSMFEVIIVNGQQVIHAKKSLYSDGYITAGGTN